MNEGSRIESSSKKRRVKQRSTGSFATRKPLHTVDRSHSFGPNSLFYSGGATFTPQQQHSSNWSAHFYKKPSEPKCFGCGKTGHCRKNCEPLTKAKKTES